MPQTLTNSSSITIYYEIKGVPNQTGRSQKTFMLTSSLKGKEWIPGKKYTYYILNVSVQDDYEFEVLVDNQKLEKNNIITYHYDSKNTFSFSLMSYRYFYYENKDAADNLKRIILWNITYSEDEGIEYKRGLPDWITPKTNKEHNASKGADLGYIDLTTLNFDIDNTSNKSALIRFRQEETNKVFRT